LKAPGLDKNEWGVLKVPGRTTKTFTNKSEKKKKATMGDVIWGGLSKPTRKQGGGRKCLQT